MILGYVLGATSIFIWGITFVCTKYLLVDFSALEILIVRFLIAYIGLWIIHPKTMKIPFKENLYFALAGLTGVVLYQFSENIALSYTSASNVSVIVSISPLFTAIINQIFFKEKHITFRFLAGFLICIIGIAFISLNGKTDLSINPKGDILAFISALCWGFYSLFISILNSRNYDSICATRRIFFFALIFMIPLIFVGLKLNLVTFNLVENFRRFSKPINWLNILFLGFFASGLCFWAWNKACNLGGTVKMTKGLYLIPVVTIIFAFIFLGEKITWMGTVGTLLTIVGLLIAK